MPGARAPEPLRGASEVAPLASIGLEHVSRTFDIDGRRLDVLADVSFVVPDGSIVCIVGPNGSGKSTLLRLIAGLLPPDAGSIEIGGQRVAEADPRVGLVFQEARLLPWRRAMDNVAFPLELSGVGVQERRRRAQELLELVGLDRFAAAYPHQLSGGMRQRLAIARALARGPQVLLLDEPFSALDALTRERFNVELLNLWQRTRTTIVMVTHSISEAVFVSDRVIVLSDAPGRVAADVPVTMPRPRAMATIDGAAFSHAASSIRSHLGSHTTDDPIDPPAEAARRDPIEAAGVPAWFDPFRGQE